MHPKSWTQYFGEMKRLKHDFAARLRYMAMLEEGYSIRAVARLTGMSHHDLDALWLRYQRDGPSGLIIRPHIRCDGAFREKVIKDIENNCLTLAEAAVKYDVSPGRLGAWLKMVKEKGYKALYEIKNVGHPKNDMGRPTKKELEGMTELERLKYENERLRTENALLKKVKALVEEKEVRLHKIGQKPSKN